jgi:hypothetical protein
VSTTVSMPQATETTRSAPVSTTVSAPQAIETTRSAPESTPDYPTTSVKR